MEGAILGLTGAVSVFVIDSVLQRVPALSSSPVLMGGARLAAGFGAALVADRMGAREGIVNGLVAGVVLVTGLDVGTRLIGARRIDPPSSSDPARLGESWAPRLGA